MKTFMYKGECKMKKKKYYVGILSIIVFMTFLFGCNGLNEPTDDPSDQINEDLRRGLQ